MAKGLGLSWEQEERLHVAEAGRQAELRTLKKSIRAVLEKRFGTLPEMVLQRIDSAADAERLQAGLLQAMEIVTPDELDL